MRNKGVENMIMAEKIEGKRSQGKQRLTFTKSLSNWIDISEVELTRAAQDQQRRKVKPPKSGTDVEFQKKLNKKE